MIILSELLFFYALLYKTLEKTKIIPKIIENETEDQEYLAVADSEILKAPKNIIND